MSILTYSASQLLRLRPGPAAVKRLCCSVFQTLKDNHIVKDDVLVKRGSRGGVHKLRQWDQITGINPSNLNYIKTTKQFHCSKSDKLQLHSSKILTIQQGITRVVSSVGKPCRPEHGFPRPNCPGNAPIF